MQQLGSHGDGLPFGFPLDADGWGKMCSMHTHVYVHFQFQVRRALGVREHPLSAAAASLISLGQLCAVQAAEKTRRQTEGHRTVESCSRRKTGGAVCRCSCVYVHAETREGCEGLAVFLGYFLPYFFEAGSLLDLEAHVLGWQLAGL